MTYSSMFLPLKLFKNTSMQKQYYRLDYTASRPSQPEFVYQIAFEKEDGHQ